ncbi:MAG: uroporphyrinogen decarboxylase family protein [Deltaproteobacteria bacterium]|nr:uroporphyrinogen decarboxylase family protein [Deltaproteobacteria bacterium]
MTAAFKETMTSRQRTICALTGQPYDRIPVNLLMSDHAARVIGVSVGEYQTSAKLMSLGQLTAWRTYGMDLINTGPGLTGIAEAAGSRLAFPDNTAYLADYALKDAHDLERLRIPDPQRDGRLPLFLEAASIVLNEVGNQVPVSLTTAGPFTTAANIRGPEHFLRDLHRDPKFVHNLLRFATDSIFPFARAAYMLGAAIGLADPVASGTLISPGQFKEFAFPYLKELVTRLAEFAGVPPSLHICGKTSRIWREMADTGARVLSLDDEIDLAEARDAVGDRVALVGNIRPTATMVMGTTNDVRTNVLECLVKGGGSPKGYILGLGCALPINTPPENVHALVAAAREYGRWPIDNELDLFFKNDSGHKNLFAW